MLQRIRIEKNNWILFYIITLHYIKYCNNDNIFVDESLVAYNIVSFKLRRHLRGFSWILFMFQTNNLRNNVDYTRLYLKKVNTPQCSEFYDQY